MMGIRMDLRQRVLITTQMAASQTITTTRQKVKTAIACTRPTSPATRAARTHIHAHAVLDTQRLAALVQKYIHAMTQI